MVNPFTFLLERLRKPPAHEGEYQENVEHDVVMRVIDGELTEVTGDDPEIREQK